MTPAKPCCCGHMRWEHRQDGAGSCRVCGGIACPKFHDVGEGHGYAFEIVLAVLAVLVLLAIVACARHRSNGRDTVDAFEFYQQEKNENATL